MFCVYSLRTNGGKKKSERPLGLFRKVILIKRRVENLKVQRPNRLMQIGLDMGRARGSD